MLRIILSITLAVLIWFRFLKPMNHFTKMGVKQTKPWPILGDIWRNLFQQMNSLESVEFYYKMFPGARMLVELTHFPVLSYLCAGNMKMFVSLSILMCLVHKTVTQQPPHIVFVVVDDLVR
ncbi:hypothetical protein HUJ04_008169 [Dendroctonus ponderosae]|nr:hypothetical protein HUJ04_008169 [Dendroctonus ponderosae]